MLNTNTDATGDRLKVEQWLQVRKEAGLKIDPATVEVDYEMGCPADPYCIRDREELHPEQRQTGRVYFARSPGSDIWVHFGDLPDATRNAVWERIKAGTLKRVIAEF